MHEHEDLAEADSGRAVHKRARIAWAAASAACVLLAVLAIVSFSRQVSQESKKPAAEIYFSNPSNIASWGNSRSLSFSFVVHNLASRTYGYRYEISMISKGNVSTLIADKILNLGPKQEATVKATLKAPTGKFQVAISLDESTNRIFFWTRAPSSPNAALKHTS